MNQEIEIRKSLKKWRNQCVQIWYTKSPNHDGKDILVIQDTFNKTRRYFTADGPTEKYDTDSTSENMFAMNGFKRLRQAEAGLVESSQ